MWYRLRVWRNEEACRPDRKCILPADPHPFREDVWFRVIWLGGGHRLQLRVSSCFSQDSPDEASGKTACFDRDSGQMPCKGKTFSPMGIRHEGS
jgi:hypothetical protein